MCAQQQQTNDVQKSSSLLPLMFLLTRILFLTLYTKNTDIHKKETSDKIPKSTPYIFEAVYTYKGIVRDKENDVHKTSVKTKQYPFETNRSNI